MRAKIVVGVSNYSFIPYHHICATGGLVKHNNCDFPGLGPVILEQILSLTSIEYSIETVAFKSNNSNVISKHFNSQHRRR